MIGTGIAGLTAARLLDRTHAVTLYEADERVGGHTNTIRVDDPRGERWVDTGFIVHNDRNYPAVHGACSTSSGSRPRQRRWGCRSPPPTAASSSRTPARGLFAQRSNLLRPRFWRLIRDQLRFNREVRPLPGAPTLRRVGEFLRDAGYSRWFCERAIVPEISAVWSADPEAIWEFPLGFLAEFLENHGQLQLTGRPRWRTIAGGSRVYVERLLERFGGRVLAGAPVRRSSGCASGVRVSAEGAGAEVFDEVVIATHSDQALAMLAAPTRAERRGARSDALPAERGGPAHRRLADAAPPPRLGELELPPRRRRRRRAPPSPTG